MALHYSQTDRFTDSNGDPIAGGSLYIGEYGQDPEANPITIYSDEALTTAISNPVTLDSYGRPSTDIYVSTDFSYEVRDSAGVNKEGPKDRRLSSRTNFSASLSVEIITLEEVSTNKYNINEGWVSLPPNGIYWLKFPTAPSGATVITIDSIDATEYVLTWQGEAIQSGVISTSMAYGAEWDGASFNITSSSSSTGWLSTMLFNG